MHLPSIIHLPPRPKLLRLRQLALRAAGALLCSALLVAIATLAVFLTTEPPVICYLFEPFSLLLLPGLMISLLAAAGAHDFNPNTVSYASLAWYFVFFYLILTWRYRRRARLIPGLKM